MSTKAKSDTRGPAKKAKASGTQRKKTRTRRKKSSQVVNPIPPEEAKAAPAEEPVELQSPLERLDFAYWPARDGASGRREVIFDTLHEEDRAELEARGYSVILLRTLSTEDQSDIVYYNRFLLRGVIDGTVQMSKERAEALELDMRHRQMLSKHATGNLKPRQRLDDLEEILDWDKSRHTVDNTTIVDPEDLKKLLSKLEPEGKMQ